MVANKSQSLIHSNRKHNHNKKTLNKRYFPSQLEATISKTQSTRTIVYYVGYAEVVTNLISVIPLKRNHYTKKTIMLKRIEFADDA